MSECDKDMLIILYSAFSVTVEENTDSVLIKTKQMGDRDGRHAGDGFDFRMNEFSLDWIAYHC